MDTPPAERTSLGELARLFVRLGTTAFGGPAAHVALMEDEVVRRRRWMSRADFLDYVGATNLIPGPNSTELAIHIGYLRGGWPGLVVAGACFIVPAACIVTAIAWAYVRYGALPEIGALRHGIAPVVVAVVAQAIWGLARTAVRTRWLAAIGVAALVATALGANELLVLGAAALVGMATARATRRPPVAAVLAPTLALGPAAGTAIGGVALWPLFTTFLKIGSVLFGSGYVLLAFLRNDLVVRLGWLTERQLVDAVAVGQMTPGPVFTTATFVGYVLAGGAGAAVATLGIFLPAFVFVALSGAIVPRIRRSPVAAAALDGVNVASLALMIVVAWQLGRGAIVDVWTLGLALVSAVLLVRYRVNSLWLVLGGAAIGLLLRALG